MPHQPRGGVAAIIGVYSCWSCRMEVPVRLSAKGNLSAPCAWCGFPHYASANTDHFNNLKAAVRPHERAPAAPGSVAMRKVG